LLNLLQEIFCKRFLFVNKIMNNDTISMNDLVLIARIIDVAASRGAFKAEELSEVGSVYDRIAAIVNQSQITQSNTPNTGE
jgi:hypothetical protein